MARYRQQPKDLTKYITDTEKRVSRLERTPRLPTAAINRGDLTVDGGNITVTNGDIEIDGGNFTLVNQDSTELVRFGDIGVDAGGGPLEPGWMFRRANPAGSVAMALLGDKSTPQELALFDANLNVLWADDTIADGLAVPPLAIQWVKSSIVGSMEVTTTSGTFGSTYRLHYPKWHPKITCWFVAQTPAGVSAEVQLVDSFLATTLPGSQTTIPANTFAYASITGTNLHDHGFFTVVDFQMRVSSGAGTVGMSMVSAFGAQS